MNGSNGTGQGRMGHSNSNPQSNSMPGPGVLMGGGHHGVTNVDKRASQSVHKVCF